jgi:hypothetical protein
MRLRGGTVPIGSPPARSAQKSSEKCCLSQATENCLSKSASSRVAGCPAALRHLEHVQNGLTADTLQAIKLEFAADKAQRQPGNERDNPILAEAFFLGTVHA